jgi:hypothetical protein
MSLSLTANVSKPGTLRYLARRAGEEPPESPQELLDVVAANNLAAANFTGSLVLPRGGMAFAPACIADGADMVIWAVAQDQEGTYAGRWPNNSTMSRWATLGR